VGLTPESLQRRTAPPDHPQAGALAKAEPAIQRDGRIVREYMQEWDLPPSQCQASEMQCDRRTQAGTARVRVNADRTQLDEPGQAETFAANGK
jgi:hypothetical protein